MPGHLQGERDVLADGLGRQELEVLEHDADLAPHVRHLAPRQLGEVVAVEGDRALRRQLVADQELHERGLAGPGRADEEDEVALGHDEVDVLERVAAVRVGLRHVVEDEHRPAGSTARRCRRCAGAPRSPARRAARGVRLE